MVFSNPIFLFAFLPITLVLYYLSTKRLKNITLLLASLFFYSWGETFYLIIMLASITSNYYAAKLIYFFRTTRDNQGLDKVIFIIGIFVNIILLFTFKYTNFIVENMNSLLYFIHMPPIYMKPIHLPLGISFFTFQAISYIVDVYRKEVAPQKSLLGLALYISLFPQLIAGPIVRYHDVVQQINHRFHSINLFSSGITRFIIGLSKKILIANPLAEIADNAFALTMHEITAPMAWLGILAYSLQIYFDFSGYSDMAIGLGRMFGFRFFENFNYPYIARNMRDFWRRWHISLSLWFKDYVYIPLGGSRDKSETRVLLNLFIVFLLTGVWHGASWNFIIWGLFHGVFLVIERAGLANAMKKIWLPFQHLYTIFVILISWVFFRSENLTDSIIYLKSMFGLNGWRTNELMFNQVVASNTYFVIVCLGLLFATPIYPTFKKKFRDIAKNNFSGTTKFLYMNEVIILSSCMFLCILRIAATTYDPFIYFRF